MNDFCITTLSCGSKYNEYLKHNLLANDKVRRENVNVFVTTDNKDFFAGDSRVKCFDIASEKVKDVRSNRNRNWFNYHLKRHAIRNALNEGYNKILYIDSDTKLLDWDKDFFIKKERGFWFRTFLGRDQYIEKYKFYDALYGVDNWHYYRPVSEKLIYINECDDKINGFLNVWDNLVNISKGKVNPYSEGHEILISCRFNGASVNKYRPDPFKGNNKYLEDSHI